MDDLTKELNYSHTDFETMKADIQRLIPLLTPEWVNAHEADLGIALVNVFCGIADMLDYYMNEQAKETYIDKARLRESVISITKLIGYTLNRPKASSSQLQITLNQAITDPINLFKYTAFTTVDGKNEVVLTEDVTILPEDTVTNINVVQGTPKIETFTAIGGDYQEYELVSRNVAFDLFEVKIGSKEYKELNRDTYLYGNTERYVYVVTDESNVTRVRFSKDLTTDLPLAGETIRVSFIETAAENGRLSAQMITRTKTAGVLPSGVSLSQPKAFVGGAPATETERAKELAPRELRTLWRAVTLEDYEALVKGYPGVLKVGVRDNEMDSSIPTHEVRVTIVTPDAKAMSPYFKSELESFLQRIKVLTVHPVVSDAGYSKFYPVADIHVYRGYSQSTVINNIKTALKEAFSVSKRELGQPVLASEVRSVMESVQGVSKVTLTMEDIPMSPTQIGIYGSATINVVGVV